MIFVLRLRINLLLLFWSEVAFLLEFSFESIQHNISIGHVTSCKDHYLIVLLGFLEAIVGIRPHIDSSLHGLSSWESDRYWKIVR